MLTPVPPSECTRARESVSARLDGELSELEAAHLEGHLRACRACRTYTAHVGAVANALRVAPLERVDLPVFLTARRRVTGIQVAAAALVVAAVTGSSFAIGRTVGSHGPSRARPAATTRLHPSDADLLGMLRGRQPARMTNRIILI